MVTFIGPACKTKMDLVGVIWMLVTFAGVPDPSIPNHLYVVPFTLIFPAHPMTDPAPYAVRCRASH